jgi:hypothetical protein
VSEALHPSTPHHLPGFITAPGDTDALMVVVGIFLIGAVLMVGIFYLHLHTMPERMAHKSQKLQFEIVAVLGLLALFTHNHLFWVIGLFLAMIDLPDFSTPLRRIAGSVEKMAGVAPEPDAAEAPDHTVPRAAKISDVVKTSAAVDEIKSKIQRDLKRGGAGQCLNFSSAPPSRSFRTISIAAIGRESASATKSRYIRFGSSCDLASSAV